MFRRVFLPKVRGSICSAARSASGVLFMFDVGRFGYFWLVLGTALLSASASAGAGSLARSR